MFIWQITPLKNKFKLCRNLVLIYSWHNNGAMSQGCCCLGVISVLKLDWKTVFLHIQVCWSSQTKGLERGWKQGARQGRDAKSTPNGRVRLALCTHKTLTPCFTHFFTDLEKKMIVLQSMLKSLITAFALTQNAPVGLWRWYQTNFIGEHLT